MLPRPAGNHVSCLNLRRRNDYTRETVLALAGEFGYRLIWKGNLIKEGWKYISLKALKILPVEVEVKED